MADKRSREESDTSDDVEDEKRQKRIRNDMVDERMAKEWVTALKQLIKGKTTIGREVSKWAIYRWRLINILVARDWRI